MRRSGLLVLALLALPACTTTGSSVYRAHFPLITTRTGPLFGYQLEGARRTSGMQVELRSHTILWMPTRVTPPTLEEAIEETLRRGDGNAVVDAVVEHWWWYVPPFYGQEGWRVTGDVVDTRSVPEETEAVAAPESRPGSTRPGEPDTWQPPGEVPP